MTSVVTTFGAPGSGFPPLGRVDGPCTLGLTTSVAPPEAGVSKAWRPKPEACSISLKVQPEDQPSAKMAEPRLVEPEHQLRSHEGTLAEVGLAPEREKRADPHVRPVAADRRNREITRRRRAGDHRCVRLALRIDIQQRDARSGRDVRVREGV